MANPLWGAPRIPGELLKLGIEISERSVSGIIILDCVPFPLRHGKCSDGLVEISWTIWAPEKLI